MSGFLPLFLHSGVSTKYTHTDSIQSTRGSAKWIRISWAQLQLGLGQKIAHGLDWAMELVFVATSRTFGSGFGMAGLESGSGPAGIEDRIWMVVVGLAIYLTYILTYLYTYLFPQNNFILFFREKKYLVFSFLFSFFFFSFLFYFHMGIFTIYIKTSIYESNGVSNTALATPPCMPCTTWALPSFSFHSFILRSNFPFIYFLCCCAHVT